MVSSGPSGGVLGGTRARATMNGEATFSGLSLIRLESTF